MQQANATHAMVRRDGPITSVMAAEVAARRKLTVRARVETFARFRPHGFIDADLFEFARDLHIALGEKEPPESTYRKRRTELCAENRIVADVETRKNDHDQAAKVFYHRDHLNNPPPIRVPEAKRSQFDALHEEIARLRAELAAERSAVIEYLGGIERGEHRRAR